MLSGWWLRCEAFTAASVLSTCPLIWGMWSLTLVSMSLSTRYPRCTSMIICWGQRRPLPSSLFSLAMQLSSVFSSRPSSSQVRRCWGCHRGKGWAELTACAAAACWLTLVYLHSEVSFSLSVQRFRVLLPLHWCKQDIRNKHVSIAISWEGFIAFTYCILTSR